MLFSLQTFHGRPLELFKGKLVVTCTEKHFGNQSIKVTVHKISNYFPIPDH